MLNLTPDQLAVALIVGPILVLAVVMAASSLLHFLVFGQWL